MMSRLCVEASDSRRGRVSWRDCRQRKETAQSHGDDAQTVITRVNLGVRTRISHIGVIEETRNVCEGIRPPACEDEDAEVVLNRAEALRAEWHVFRKPDVEDEKCTEKWDVDEPDDSLVGGGRR